MLKQIIQVNKPVTYSEIIQINKRNPEVIKKSLDRFTHAGFLIKESKTKKCGRNKALISYNHYSINKDNEVMNFLLK